MNTQYDFETPGEDRIVYVRPVAVADLPADIREQAMGAETLFALHNADGERLALVKDRTMAFILAEQNDYSAVNVH